MAIVLQSMQEIETSFAAADASKTQVVTHGLIDDAGNIIQPDAIITEIVAFTATGALALYAFVGPVARSTPGATQFTASIFLNKAPGGADTAKVKVRYSAIRWPIFQGSDVTP